MRRAAVLLAVAVVAIGAAPSRLAPRAAADAAHPAYYSTQIGHPWDAPVQRIAARADGTVVVAGFTYEASLPATVTRPQGAAPTFLYVAEIAADGLLGRISYAPTRVRPGEVQPVAWVRALALADDGGVWIAGVGSVAPAGLPDLGNPNGPFDRDAWVAKFRPDGTVAFATNLGGTDDDQVNGLTLLPGGDAIVVGTTQSRDFPVASASQPVHGGGHTDGFVARVRGDGTGLAWSSYLGGADDDDASAVAVDAADEIVVARQSRQTNYGDLWESDRDAFLLAADVARLGADGAVVATVRLPHAGWGGVYSLAIDASGRVLVGGSASFRGADAAESFVLRLDRAASAVEDVWREVGWPVRRIGFLPTGDLLFTFRYDGRSSASVVAADFRSGSVPVALSMYAVANTYRSPIVDAVAAPDGAVCCLGFGPGVPFGAETRRAASDSMFVAKVPLAGTRPPSRFRLRRIAEETAEAVWTADGDPAASYEVELAESAGAGAFTFRRVGTAPAGAASAQVAGLRPGDLNYVRLVAVFPSGVRAASAQIAGATTKPVAPTDLAAAPGADGFADVSFASRNGDQVNYEIERRDGDGPWLAVQRVEGWQRGAGGGFTTADDVASLGGETVVYRVRSVTKHERTAWVESAPIRIGDATLRLEQTGGSVRAGANRRRRVAVSARFLAADGSAAPRFEPISDDLRIRVGDAPSFLTRITIPAGDAGWVRRSDGGLRWSGSGAEDFGGSGPFRVDLDPERGTVSVRYVTGTWGFARDATRVAIVVSYGGLSGGEERAWRPASGPSPSLDWR